MLSVKKSIVFSGIYFFSRLLHNIQMIYYYFIFFDITAS
jgi:hypothetical protein